MKEYKVVIDGQEHSFLYSDEDAKRLGLKVETKAAEKPANKSRTAKNKKA
jgi:hypothetical protein